MIFALCKLAHINNEELHHYMTEWTGVTSLSGDSCSSSQAINIIANIESIINIRKASVSNRKGTITEKQINAIKTLQRILKWHDGRINGFISHTTGDSCIEDLKVKDASKVIVGLRKMIPSDLINYNKNIS